MALRFNLYKNTLKPVQVADMNVQAILNFKQSGFFRLYFKLTLSDKLSVVNLSLPVLEYAWIVSSLF